MVTILEIISRVVAVYRKLHRLGGVTATFISTEAISCSAARP